ncbi:MAG TPA: ribose 5-phosphate isomerase B [Planctomycetota bacterium]|nr:ribose 5-phosphate isomerase B [Planctomycetota bacterium]
MKIALAADHAGLATKQRLMASLQGAGHEVLDRGTTGTDSVDYPDFASIVAHDVAEGRAERGILVCGTGIGMSIAANKVAGVRAAKVNDPYEATMSRQHNDANVLCLGSRVLDSSVVDEIVRNFIGTAFEGGRHARRVAKMMALESAPQAGVPPCG